MTTTNKYSKGKVYKLVNNIDDKIYVGSTTQSLPKRKGGHKVDAKKQTERCVYKHLNQIGWDNVDIILIENFSCNHIDELKRRERHFIDLLKPELNSRIPTRTLKEYLVENTDKLKEYYAEYNAKNADKIKEYYVEYNAKNADKLKEYKAEYYVENADKFKEYNAKYRAKNADKIKEQKAKYYAKKKQQV